MVVVLKESIKNIADKAEEKDEQKRN